MCHSQVSFPSRVTRKVLCASSRAPYKTTPRGRALEAGWRLSRPSRGRACAAPRRILRRAIDLVTAAPAPSSGRVAAAASRPQPRRRPAASLSAPLRGAQPTGSRSGSKRVAMWPTAAIGLKGAFSAVEAVRAALFLARPLAQYPVSTPTESRRPRGRQGRARGQWTYWCLRQYVLGSLIDILD